MVTQIFEHLVEKNPMTLLTYYCQCIVYILAIGYTHLYIQKLQNAMILICDWYQCAIDDLLLSHCTYAEIWSYFF